MLGKFLLAVMLCFFPLNVFVQNQNESKEIPQSDLSNGISGFMTFLFQLEKIAANGYCKKNTTTLPIWCSNCKQRRLSLGEFSACLMLQSSETTYSDFLKLLASTDTKEADMAAFVLVHMKSIRYVCTNCKNTSWEQVHQVQ